MDQSACGGCSDHGMCQFIGTGGAQPECLCNYWWSGLHCDDDNHYDHPGFVPVLVMRISLTLFIVVYGALRIRRLMRCGMHPYRAGKLDLRATQHYCAMTSAVAGLLRVCLSPVEHPAPVTIPALAVVYNLLTASTGFFQTISLFQATHQWHMVTSHRSSLVRPGRVPKVLMAGHLGAFLLLYLGALAPLIGVHYDFTRFSIVLVNAPALTLTMVYAIMLTRRSKNAIDMRVHQMMKRFAIVFTIAFVVFSSFPIVIGKPGVMTDNVLRRIIYGNYTIVTQIAACFLILQSGPGVLAPVDERHAATSSPAPGTIRSARPSIKPGIDVQFRRTDVVDRAGEDSGDGVGGDAHDAAASKDDSDDDGGGGGGDYDGTDRPLPKLDTLSPPPVPARAWQGSDTTELAVPGSVPQ